MPQDLNPQNPEVRKKHQGHQVPAGTQICNPSYAGGRDQEDHSSKPAQENSSGDPILKKKKKTITKRSGGVA
jgi:hypothetical protein